MSNGNPEGKYTDVRVVPIQGGSGNLSGGTGILSSFGVFSCRDFASNDLPEVDKYYNISGYNGGNRYEFPKWKCTGSAKTSDFKAAQ